MQRGVRIGVAVLLFALLAGTANAKDFCLGFGNDPTAIWVGKDFKVPSKGKCKPWNGFLLTTFANVSIATGTACASSDGTLLRLQLSLVRENIVFMDYMRIPLPSLANGEFEEFITGPPTLAGPPIHFTGLGQVDCPAKNVPIP